MTDDIAVPPWFWLGREADAIFIAQVASRSNDHSLSRRVIDTYPIQVPRSAWEAVGLINRSIVP